MTLKNILPIHQVDVAIDKEELLLIKECIDKKWLTEGEKTKVLAKKITSFTGYKYVTFAPNGTLALYLSLLALDLKKGDEVIVPDFTFYASATSCIFAGLKPVFVDVCPKTFTLDSRHLEEAISEKTKAIMPVHMYGQSCDMDPILALAKKYNLKVIEDAAQAFGVKYKGQHVGALGNIGMFSFFSDKVITMGEGAVIVTNDDHLFKKLSFLRNQGRQHSGTFIHPELGMNFRITDLQAAVALSQLGKFPDILEARLRLCHLYHSLLKDVGDICFLHNPAYSNWVPFRFCITTGHKEALGAHLKENYVQTRSFFYPLHKQPKLKGYRKLYCKTTEALYEKGLCLPVHCSITEEDVHRICSLIKEFFLDRKM